jgi:hypothetical protein
MISALSIHSVESRTVSRPWPGQRVPASASRDLDGEVILLSLWTGCPGLVLVGREQAECVAQQQTHATL